MATTTTTLSGSYLQNWEDFKTIFTASLDPDSDGTIGNDNRGPSVKQVDRALDKFDKFFSDTIGAELVISDTNAPTIQDFTNAIDPDGDGKIGTGIGPSVDSAIQQYEQALRKFGRNLDSTESSLNSSSTTLFGAPESIGLGVEATTSQGPKGKDAVIFGGAEPTSKFSDLVGSEPQVLSSPDILDIGGQTEIVDPFANDPDQIDLFKNKG